MDCRNLSLFHLFSPTPHYLHHLVGVIVQTITVYYIVAFCLSFPSDLCSCLGLLSSLV